MGNRITALIIEPDQSAAKHLKALLDKTCQVDVVGIATCGETGIRLCQELHPESVFLDINSPGKDGVSLASELTILPQPPRLVFTTADRNRAVDAFRLDAVDYLLKPLAPIQVAEAVNRLQAVLRPFETESWRVAPNSEIPSAPNSKAEAGGPPIELLPVKDADSDKIRLLSRREVVAAVRKGRRSWIHTVREEFATNYPLVSLARWLGGRPFVRLGRHAVVNARAIDRVTYKDDRLCRVQLFDRPKTHINASRTAGARLAAVLEPSR